MSFNILNGYVFDKDYSLRELTSLLDNTMPKFQNLANSLYLQKYIEELFYIYDCSIYFGQSIAEKRLSSYFKNTEESQTLDMAPFYISRYLNKSFNLNCNIQIIPIEGKILALYFGERVEFEELFSSLPFIKEYSYQNEYMGPELVSESEVKQRKKDWEEALPIGSAKPIQHGFVRSLVSPRILLFPIKEEFEKYNCSCSLKSRAQRLALDLDFPCEKFTVDVFFSKEYQKFIEEKTEEISKRLIIFKSDDEIVDIFDRL